MKNKKVIYFAILLISLLAISGVSASEIDERINGDSNFYINEETTDELDMGLISESTNLEKGIHLENFESEHDNQILDDNDIVYNNEDYNESVADTLSNSIVVNSSDFNDLKLAIDSANDGDTIEIKGNYTQYTSENININKSLNFIGYGSNSYLNNFYENKFNICSESITFENINFNSFYGPMRITSDFIMFKNCNFTNNVYGVIFINSSKNILFSNCNFFNNYEEHINYRLLDILNSQDIFLINCSFINNTDAVCFSDNININVLDSDFINTNGHAINFQCSSGINIGASIFNCTFKNNKGVEGAAINVRDYMCNLSIKNSTFINNTVVDWGGAILVWSASNTTIENCWFEDNHASQGGAINFYRNPGGENLKIINSNFLHNNYVSVYICGQDNVTINNCSFENTYHYKQYSNARGSAIYLEYMEGEILNSKFNNNSADYGGAIYILDSNCTISNSNFSNNSARYSGGVLFIQNSYDLGVYLINNIMYDNTAINEQYIYCGDYLSVANAKINVLNRDSINNYLYENSFVEIFITDDNGHTITGNIAFRLNNNTFYDIKCNEGYSKINFTWEQFGLNDIYIFYYHYQFLDRPYCSENLTLDVMPRPNTYNYIHYLIDNAENNSVVDISGNYIVNNSPVIIINKSISLKGIGNQQTIFDGNGSSRIFIINASNVILENICFKNCKNALNISGENITIKNCSFINCSALNGGAVLIKGNNICIEDSTFLENYATYNGGAIDLEGNNISFYDCNFVDNFAGSCGGALELDSEDVILDNCQFIDNSADNLGGAIDCSGNFIDIGSCTFIENYAESSGGSIYCAANNLTIVSSIFRENVAKNGGAIYLSGDEIFITYSDFIGNAAINGGVLYVMGDLMYFGDNNIKNNTALNEAGAIYLSGEEHSISDCIFINNSAKNESGAILWLSENSTIENSVFLNNSAELNKSTGAISWYAESGTFENVYVDDDSVSVSSNMTLSKPKMGLSISLDSNIYKNTKMVVELYVGSKGIPNQKISLKFSNGNVISLTTDEYGFAFCTLPYDAGSYSVEGSFINGNLTVKKKLSFTINKIPTIVTPTALSTTYDSGKYFTIKLVEKNTKKVLANKKLKLRIYTGTKYKDYTVTTNSKGIVNFKASTLAVGTHKVEITSAEKNYAVTKTTSTIKIAKAKTTVKAPKVTYKYKKSKYFSVTVKNKATKKVVKSLKVKVKVYTGKKYKTYTIKTNSKGIAKLNTKTLAKGTHKVVISSGNSNYAISAKSTIVIKK